ncbi:L-lactate dehydrogenase [Flammeovirgaceae bacterium 311]|nr:L-lactate dehydrogenase [Flammeovirgaceae bacterium 311]
MKRTIGIIGIGSVGTSVAFSVLQTGLADELLLHDARQERAEGEAMDMAHGVSFYPTATVRTATPEQMLKADAIVIAAGRGGKPEESRLDLLKDNARIIKELGEKLKSATGLLIMIANPVDVLTYVLQKASGLPPERVIGTGTMLDTARLRQILGRELELESDSIHAQVIGEHGDSEVVLWSGAEIGGALLRDWPGWTAEKEEKLSREVRTAAQEIIKRKGVTNHAIGLVTAALLKWALRGERRVLTVSRVQDGTFGLKDVALSLPTIVGSDGATRVLEPQMDEQELKALKHSAEVIKKAIQSIED